MTERSRGVALLTVLLVVALATVTATALATLLQLDIRRTGLLAQQRQARAYLQGAEQWAEQILARDRAAGPIDDLAEPWARKLPPLPVAGGYVQGRLDDLQGRFNLNDLLAGHSVDPRQLALLQRLLAQLGLPVGPAAAIADWVDPDTSPRLPDGAEDSTYLDRTPAYLAANRPFVSVSELRLIRGIDATTYQQLAPLVSALPDATPINVNTAPAELLAALDPRLSHASVEHLLQVRQRQPFATAADFLKATGLTNFALPGSAIGTASRYFLLTAEARVGDTRVRLHSLLVRGGDGTTRSLLRSYGDDW